jgi:hypothetical protein
MYTASIGLVKTEHSISLVRNEEKFLPLIFAAGAIDINYRFSTMGLALDDKSLDKIESI